MNNRVQYFIIPLLVSILIVPFIPSPVRSLDIWYIYVPTSDEVGLKFWILNQTSYINVTLYIGYPCVNISSWGIVEKENSSLMVNIEFWWWGGWCWHWVAPPIHHTYDLGFLEEGLYTFSFRVWDSEVKRIPFAVGFILGDVNRDGRVRVDDLLAIVLAFGSNHGDARYDPDLDLNSDGKIRIDDIFTATENFGMEQ